MQLLRSISVPEIAARGVQVPTGAASGIVAHRAALPSVPASQVPASQVDESRRRLYMRATMMIVHIPTTRRRRFAAGDRV
jgi:hypothetical protein